MGICSGKDGAEGAKRRAAQKEFESKRDDSANINRLTLFVIQARNLPNYDFGPNSKSDPYVKVKFGDVEHAEYRTETVRRESNPVWNAHFIEDGKGLFDKVRSIRLDVFDSDLVTADDFMGYCVIKTDPSPNQYYSTAVQWVDLLDNKGAPLKGPNGEKAAIQIQLKYALNRDDINIRYYTHVMEFTVKKGKNIENKDFGGKSDAYVELEWGAQTFSTKPVHNSSNPDWNETAFLFVHSEYQNNYQLKLCVMDSDVAVDDHVGTGYIAASEVFKQCGLDGSKQYDLNVGLREMPVTLDRGLIDFTKDEWNSFVKWGDLEVQIRLKPKAVVESEFYNALLQTFDTNKDGVMDKDEVMRMFATLKLPQQQQALFNTFDENKDSNLSENEVKQMLQDADFQGSELAPQLMAIYFRGGLNGDRQKHLMTGFTHEATSTSRVINIVHRETGLLIQEYIPTYTWYALKLMYDFELSKALTQTQIAHHILSELSKARGDAMDAPESVEEIPTFIKQHNLDTRELPDGVEVDDFKTFNDFFARPLDVDKYRALAHPEDDTVITSPADCRMMLWDSILDSTKIWIKGKRFTLESLCGDGDHKVDVNKYASGSFVIARLAPQDYHRWHYPLSGTVVNVHTIDGALYTVNPIAVNKEVDVYSDNKRAIVEVQNATHGSYIMFVIAATMVGSYALFKEDGAALKEGDVVERGAIAGEFRFGGSTVLLMFEKKMKINFDNDIQRNVNSKFETLVTARSRIGRIV